MEAYATYFPYVLAGIAIFFIGLSKAGFGGGLGVLVTPVCVIAFNSIPSITPMATIGILLPLLCVGDVFSLYSYWGKWRKENFFFLLPGILLGIILGVRLFGRFTASHLNFIIGLIAIWFVIFQWLKNFLNRKSEVYKPNYKNGTIYGFFLGLTSTFAHGAGPVATMYLLPQKMKKEIYMGTTIFIFSFVNLFKLPFFAIDQSMINLPFFTETAIINWQTIKIGLCYSPLVPLGVWTGIWLNRKFSETQFVVIIYVLTGLTGLDLVWQSSFWEWFK